MRHLANHPEPPELSAVQPLTVPWKSLPLPIKAAIRKRLYRHQYGLCGYCEGSLAELGQHIEHVEPKGGIGSNPARIYDYSNLIASCQGDTHIPKSLGQDGSCGHYKDGFIVDKGRFDLGDFISPWEAGCESKFLYLSDGRVIPRAKSGTTDYLRSDYTIKAVGLNCNRLRNRRRQISAKLVRQIQRFQTQPALLQQLLDHYLGTHSDTNGQNVLLPFFSTRKHRFSKL